MKRRSLLKGAAAVAIGAACPGWIRSAFAEESCNKAVTPKRGLIAMSDGFRAAQRAGRALLVFVIPEDEGARWKPAHAFGEYLNHGTDEQLLPLAALEVVCAKMSTLRTLVPSGSAGRTVDGAGRDGSISRVRPRAERRLARVQGCGPDGRSHDRLAEDPEGAHRRRRRGCVSQRIAAVAGVLRAATIDDPASARRTRRGVARGAVERRD